MYKAYLFHANGRYQAPVYLDSNSAIVTFVFRYIDIAPKIRITKSDEIVFETDAGTVTHPDISPLELQAMRSRVVSLPVNSTIEELINTYTRRVDVFRSSRGKDKDTLQSMFQIETDLFALAAREGVNLTSYGWVSAGVIDAQLNATF